jgi:hypothetical protein
MGKRFGRWLLPDNRLLDIARGAPMNGQNSDIGDPAETLDWLVYRIGSPNMLLGSVIAPTLETALAAAFRKFNVTPVGRKRIVVWQVSGDS